MNIGATDTRRLWLFQNGAGDWLRWGVAMIIGAVLTWAAVQSRVSVLEAQIGNLQTQLSRTEATLDRLDDRTRAAITALNTTMIQLHNGN